jgi:hypothetical protein
VRSRPARTTTQLIVLGLVAASVWALTCRPPVAKYHSPERLAARLASAGVPCWETPTDATAHAAFTAQGALALHCWTDSRRSEGFRLLTYRTPAIQRRSEAEPHVMSTVSGALAATDWYISGTGWGADAESATTAARIRVVLGDLP